MQIIYCKKYLQNVKYNELFHKKRQIRERGVEDILFWTPWSFSFIYFTSGNSRQIKAPPLEIVQNCVTSPLEIPRPKNRVQTKTKIVKGRQTSVIHLIPGSTCDWISNWMRYFFRNIFWSKHFPEATNCRSWYSGVFLVTPVLKISQMSQKNIPSKCQLTYDFVWKSNFTGIFYLKIYEVFRTAILRNCALFCVS